jgi:hypothetical protein
MINLWSALTALEGRDLSCKIGKEDLQELSDAARWNGQEITLKATPDGWLINVFSCYSEDGVTGIEILIPKDRNPVKIIKDRDGRVEYHHD